MKRLFYATNSLDDAHAISDEVHDLGIDDHHFYVLSRDESGIKAHHLHGSSNIDKTEIIAAKKRANKIAAAMICAFSTILLIFTDAFFQQLLWALISLSMIFLLIEFVLQVTANSFDSYFKSMFNERLDSGDVIIIIDVEKQQTKQVETQLNKHPDAQFLADSSNLASPIPD